MAQSWLDRNIRSTTWSEAIRNKDFGAIADWFTSYSLIVGINALVFLGIAAGWSGTDGACLKTCPKPTVPSFPLGFRVFALGLLLAGACTVVGWLFGFLFGIPRAVATTAPTPGGRTSKVNTNLEDISDWLTKTLVGVGLTQLLKFPVYLGDLASNANQYGFAWGDYGILLALGIILYFTPVGFWLGYVGTRTLLTKLLDMFDGVSQSDIDRAADPDNLLIDSNNLILPAHGNVKQIDAQLLSLPMHALSTTEEVAAWAAAQARAGNLDAARVALEGASREKPTDETIKRQLVKINVALGYFDKSADLAEQIADSPPKVLAALYEQQPGGFTKALTIGEQLIKEEMYKDSASLHVWLACAYAQKYGYEQRTNTTDQLPAILTDLKNKVLENANRAIVLQPTTRGQMFQFWQPKKDSIDNDLSVFSPDDADLRKLLSPQDDVGPQASPAPPPQPGTAH